MGHTNKPQHQEKGSVPHQKVGVSGAAWASSHYFKRIGKGSVLSWKLLGLAQCPPFKASNLYWIFYPPTAGDQFFPLQACCKGKSSLKMMENQPEKEKSECAGAATSSWHPLLAPKPGRAGCQEKSSKLSELEVFWAEDIYRTTGWQAVWEILYLKNTSVWLRNTTTAAKLPCFARIGLTSHRGGKRILHFALLSLDSHPSALMAKTFFKQLVWYISCPPPNTLVWN